MSERGALGEEDAHGIYEPLRAAHEQAVRRSGTFAVGHIAQSLDGRIATRGGISQWISGEEDLVHTHRMRALADAVLVGVNTVLLDNPRLTVRRCAGRSPVRVVVDPNRRLDGSQRIFNDEAAPTLILARADRVRERESLNGAEIVPVPCSGAGLDPLAMRRILGERGLTWLFIEGGGITISSFLAARALDRLQLTIAPLIIGSGRPSLSLPAIENLGDGLRPRTRRVTLGADVMIECDFDA